MNKLVIQDDEGKTTVVPLIRDEITIGRKEGNTIRLTERNVSRRHARILRANGAVAIEDLNSYNGVRVNGTRIQGRCQLNVSDRIQIGDYLIELKSDAEAVAADGHEQRTQPIERIDPMTAPGNGAGPGASQPMPTAVVDVNRIQGAPAPVSFGAQGAGAAAATPAVDQSVPGRVVILSTNFAGQDHELSKPAMVIGRTEENDIVVNHRSISRHHAKIVRENGRYAIVDLQSSNGVRVNGEEYGKVELRRGDIIDLGHVRMRFVEPGEDFLFGRDAQAVDISGGGGKGLIYGLLALLLVGGGIGLFVAMSGGDSADASTQPGASAGVTPGDGDGDGDGDSKPAAGDGDEPAAMAKGPLADAEKAIEAEDWKAAKAEAEKVLADDGDNPRAAEIVEQATRELNNQIVYDQFKAAVTKKDYPKIAQLFDKLEGTSVYKEQARDDHDRARDEYTADWVQRAKGLVADNDCKSVSKLADKVSKVWTEAGDAVREEADKCTAPAVAVAPKPKSDPKPKPKPKSDPKPKPDSNGGSASTSGKSAAELTTDARAAAKVGQWGKALRLCESALAKKRNDQEAAMVCALASCNIKSASKAKKYMKILRSPSRKGMARQICLKNQVDVPIN